MLSKRNPQVYNLNKEMVEEYSRCHYVAAGFTCQNDALSLESSLVSYISSYHQQGFPYKYESTGHTSLNFGLLRKWKSTKQNKI